MRKLPPLIQLRAFEAAARLLSFRKAADELHVTPTAISHHIKSLEEYCQCTLFRRRPRPITLTKAGKDLFPVLERGLNEFSLAIEQIRTADIPAKLTLTTTSSFAAKWLTPNLPDWFKLYPNLSLEVIATDLLVDLHSEADLAVRYMREPVDSIGWVSSELIRDRFVAVCSPSLLKNGQPFQSIAELFEHTLIHTNWSDDDKNAPTWKRWAEQACKYYHEKTDNNQIKNLTYHEEVQAIDAAKSGAGILVVSDFLISDELSNGALVRAVDFTLPGYGFFLTYRDSHPYRKICESFCIWIQKNLRDQQLFYEKQYTPFSAPKVSDLTLP